MVKVITRLRNIVLIISSLSLLFAACTKSLTHDDFLQYVSNPDNGLVIENAVNNVGFKVTYYPSVLLAWQDAASCDSLTGEIWKKKVDTYNAYHYFKLELSANSHDLLSSTIPDRQLYSELVNRLLFDMGNHAFLISYPTDTLCFVDSHSPRLYGMGNASEVLLVYKKSDCAISDLRLDITDLGLGTGDVRFEFDKDRINNIPELIPNFSN